MPHPLIPTVHFGLISCPMPPIWTQAAVCVWVERPHTHGPACAPWCKVGESHWSGTPETVGCCWAGRPGTGSGQAARNTGRDLGTAAAHSGLGVEVDHGCGWAPPSLGAAPAGCNSRCQVWQACCSNEVQRTGQQRSHHAWQRDSSKVMSLPDPVWPRLRRCLCWGHEPCMGSEWYLVASRHLEIG